MAFNAHPAYIDVRVDGYHLYPGKIDESNERLWELKLDIALPIAEQVLGGREAAEALQARLGLPATG